MHACTHTYMQAYIHTYMHTYIHKRTHIHIHGHTYTSTHTQRARTHTHQVRTAVENALSHLLHEKIGLLSREIVPRAEEYMDVAKRAAARRSARTDMDSDSSVLMGSASPLGSPSKYGYGCDPESSPGMYDSSVNNTRDSTFDVESNSSPMNSPRRKAHVHEIDESPGQNDDDRREASAYHHGVDGATAVRLRVHTQDHSGQNTAARAAGVTSDEGERDGSVTARDERDGSVTARGERDGSVTARGERDGSVTARGERDGSTARYMMRAENGQTDEGMGYTGADGTGHASLIVEEDRSELADTVTADDSLLESEEELMQGPCMTTEEELDMIREVSGLPIDADE
jgi:hypothetical protein